MTPSLHYAFAAVTDTGRVRSHNEDAVAIVPACGLAVVADGMGGYAAGEVASDIAVSVIRDVVEQRFLRGPVAADAMWEVLVDAALEANEAILAAAVDEPSLRGMGATLVAGLFHEDRVAIAHAGDSRAYRLRDGVLMQLTRDHSVVQEQMDAGLLSVEEARHSRIRNLVTRALGVDVELTVEAHEHRVEEGDLYLFCSDGLHDMLSDEEIAELLVPGVELEELCRGLIGAANEAGGADNVSVVAVKGSPPFFRLANHIDSD
jgi:protein phosphatase